MENNIDLLNKGYELEVLIMLCKRHFANRINCFNNRFFIVFKNSESISP